MSGTIIVGTAFGDEAKGRVVDHYAESADMVVRYGGGCNAGHTLVVDGEKTILRLIPSGALHKNVKCVLAAGMVIDIQVLMQEIEALKVSGIDLSNRLFISDRAHVIKEKHIKLDKKNESGENKIGTTKKGIGPCYEDKVGRRGFRMIDFSSEETSNGGFGKFITDTSVVVNEALDNGETVIFEGAQGTMLDIDHGTYPYVTSSNAIAGGACTGVGVGPIKIDNVVGVSKAYLTRVGEGPMPTELHGEAAEILREAGAEYGSVTGRSRRVGWLDLHDLKVAARLNGMTGLVISKLDVLSNMGDIKVGVLRTKDGEVEYRTLPGWSENISSVKHVSDLPGAAQDYLSLIEEVVKVPIKKVSVGPARDQIFDA